MTTLVQSMMNDSYTANGAPTYRSSLDPLVDWFFSSGTLRHKEEDHIKELWYKAWNANPEAAIKLAFYTRDVRGGQGERKTARIIFKELASHPIHAGIFEAFLHLVPEYGRWDDLFIFFNTSLQEPVLGLISNALDEGNSLCAKWIPAEKSTRDYDGVKGSYIAKAIRRYMNLTPRQYRKMRTKLNSVVETKMCAKQWDDIDFSHVPSKAMLRLRNAFVKNCGANFEIYLEKVATGEAKINSGTVMPHEIAQIVLNKVGASGWGVDLDSLEEFTTEREVLSLQWDNLPDYLKEGTSQLILPVIDTSGSMYMDVKPRPIDVSIGLGAYIAERNEGPFKDAFITFSSNPQMQLLKGEDIFEKISNLSTVEWGGSTNITKTFQVILNHAIKNNLIQKELPSMVLILSDMEFDHGAGYSTSTVFELIDQDFIQHGYIAPQLVFWNIGSSEDNIPVKAHETGASLVSGFSPSIMQQLLKTGSVTPIDLVMEVLNSKRYSQIKI